MASRCDGPSCGGNDIASTTATNGPTTGPTTGRVNGPTNGVKIYTRATYKIPDLDVDGAAELCNNIANSCHIQDWEKLVALGCLPEDPIVVALAPILEALINRPGDFRDRKLWDDVRRRFLSGEVAGLGEGCESRRESWRLCCGLIMILVRMVSHVRYEIFFESDRGTHCEVLDAPLDEGFKIRVEDLLTSICRLEDFDVSMT